MKIFRRNKAQNDPFGGIDLGDEVKDTLTEFSGIVIATNRNISGCDQVAIQPQMQDGKFEESRWFDIERVQLLVRGKVTPSERRTGADAIPPSRNRAAT